MKTQTLLFSLLFVTASFSQNLYDKISENAISVVGINGEELLKKVSIDDLNNSPMFEEMMKRYYSGGDRTLINNLNDFGVDYSKSVYYVKENGDEEEKVDFRYLCYHIKDLSVFEDAVKNKMIYKSVDKEGDLNVINYNYYNKLYWNDSYALLIIGNYVGYEFDYYGYDYYGGDETEEVIYYEIDEPINSIDTITAEDLENMTDEEWQAYLDKQEEEQRNKEEREQKRKDEKERKRQERIEMKERTVSNAILRRTKEFFSAELNAKGTNLKSSFDPTADAFVYFSGNMSYMDLFMGRRSRRYNPMSSFMDIGNNLNGDIMANFYMRETTVDLDAEFRYPENLIDEYTNMFKSKLDKKFINYISEDDMGYMTYTVNSEALWEAYPKMIQESMGFGEEGYEEEWSLIADVITLVIDEEALGEAITGDVVFILNSLSIKTVSYLSWEYDEEFNYNSTEKTKEELVPDYTVLFGSEADELIAKILKLSVKNELLRAVEGGYQSGSDNLFRQTDFFVAYKNDIVCITSTHEKLLEFDSGGSKNKISGTRAKEIKKNASAMYLNTEELFANLIYFEGLNGEQLEMVNSIKEDMTNINAKMYFSKGVMNMEATSEVPSKYKNGAEYLLHLIDKGFKALK